MSFKTCFSQFSSVAQSCLTLCNPMNCSTPGFPVHHQLLEFTQTHVHRVGDAIQPSHPLSSPSPPAPNPSQQKTCLLNDFPPGYFIYWCKWNVKVFFWAVLRWQRNRTGRPLSFPQIQWKNIWMLSKFHKTSSDCWQRTSGTQKGSPLSLKGGRTKYKS